MSTPATFIPPEFFGFPALGRAAGQISEQIETRRKTKREEERQTRFDDAAFAEMSLQRGVTILNTLGDTPENRALVLEQWRANPILAEAIPVDADISAPASVLLDNIARTALESPNEATRQIVTNQALGLQPGQTAEQALQSGQLDLNTQRAALEATHNQLQTYREMLQGFKARGTTIGGASADQALAELDNTLKQLDLMGAQINNLNAQAEEARARQRATRADPIQAALLDEYVPIFAEQGVAPSAVSAMFSGATLSPEQAGQLVGALDAAASQARQGSVSDQVKLRADMIAADIRLPEQQAAEQLAGIMNSMAGQENFLVQEVSKGGIRGAFGGTEWGVVPKDASFKTFLKDAGFPEQQLDGILGSIETDLKNPDARAALEVNLAQMPQSAQKSALTAVVQAKARELGVALNGLGEVEGETRPQTAPQAAPVGPQAPPEAPARDSRATPAVAPTTRLERLEEMLEAREEFFRTNPPRSEQEERFRGEGTRKLQEDIAREKRVQAARARVQPRAGLQRETEFRQ